MAAILSIGAKIGCSVHTLNEWVKTAEVDSGKCAGIPTEMAERMKALERENRELRQANEILARRARILRWRSSTAGRSDGGFIDTHRDAHGVEPWERHWSE